jgi:GT2 family glycosyltransferase
VANAQPLFSVVIPTFHRNAALSWCLDRLGPGRQVAMTLVPPHSSDDLWDDVASRYEVIVTDAGGSSTAETMIRAQYPWARWVACPGKGPGPNRNHGANVARGEWLVFLDDDCLVESQWLAAIADAIRTGLVDVVEGETAIPNERDSPFYYAPHNLTGGLYWTCNLAVRRSVFTAIGGFDEDLNEQCEDMEFAHRISTASFRTVFRSDARAWHPMRHIGWRGVWRATLRKRWHRLYSLKVRRSPSSGYRLLPTILRTSGEILTNLLRTTWHLVSRHDPARWKSRWFWEVWGWVTLPLLLPYLVVWDLRFRRMLRERSAGDTDI